MTATVSGSSSPELPPLLIPTPRRVERLPGSFAFPARPSIAGTPDLQGARAALGRPELAAAPTPHEATIVCGPLAGVPADDRYALTVNRASPIVIEAAGPRGILLALSTLRQLLRQYGRAIPGLRVEDRPAFTHRGAMLDVSRDRVPRTDELLRTIDQLAELKFNHLQLYTEHTFAYTGHEDVWRDWSPITPAEARELDAYCRLRGMTLAANQNCFGHLASWLRHPRYSHLAEIQGDDTPWKFYEYERRGPFSLCPLDPGSLALVHDLLGQLVPCFSSRLVNINCDETADVGQGRSKAAVAARGGAAVYMDFIRDVTSCVERLGARPMFWADIALSHPECVPQIPADMIALAWGYEPDSPFADWTRTLRAAGREAWVCPGTSSWRSITGRTHERHANIAASLAGSAQGATGFLVTDWGDVGHRQQWPIALHGLAHAAQAAWTGEVSLDTRAESLQVFSDRSGAIGEWLERFGDADLVLRNAGGRRGADGSRGHLRNASVLFNDMHPPFEGADRVGTGREWLEVQDRLRDLGQTAPSLPDTHTNAEIAHSLDVAAFAVDRALWRRGDAPDPHLARALAHRLDHIVSEHRRLWLHRSRPGGLESSCRHYHLLRPGLSAT